MEGCPRGYAYLSGLLYHLQSAHQLSRAESKAVSKERRDDYVDRRKRLHVQTVSTVFATVTSTPSTTVVTTASLSVTTKTLSSPSPSASERLASLDAPNVSVSELRRMKERLLLQATSGQDRGLLLEYLPPPPLPPAIAEGFDPLLIQRVAHWAHSTRECMDALVEELGAGTLVEVHTDKGNCKAVTLLDLRKHLQKTPAQRSEIWNALDIFVPANNKLADSILVPSFVEENDLCRNAPEECNRMRRLFVVTGAGAFTAAHQDLTGCSTFMHIITGEKRFRLCRPTLESLRSFEVFRRCKDTHGVSFFDLLDPSHVLQVTIRAGDTFIMPGAWIHEVQTPVDTIAVTGNFLHLADMPRNIYMFEQERRLGEIKDYRFPFFVRVLWHTLRKEGGCTGQPMWRRDNLLLMKAFLERELDKQLAKRHWNWPWGRELSLAECRCILRDFK